MRRELRLWTHDSLLVRGEIRERAQRAVDMVRRLGSIVRVFIVSDYDMVGGRANPRRQRMVVVPDEGVMAKAWDFDSRAKSIGAYNGSATGFQIYADVCAALGIR